MITKYYRILRPQYLLFACILGIVVVVFANQTAIAKQLDDWQIIPRPQRVTELYFANEQALPRTTKAEAVQKVEFVVRNMEYRTTAYRYDILAVSGDDGSSVVLGNGALTLAHDQTQTIRGTVKIPSDNYSRVAIKVELKYDGFADGSSELGAQRQSVHYWMKVTK